MLAGPWQALLWAWHARALLHVTARHHRFCLPLYKVSCLHEISRSCCFRTVQLNTILLSICSAFSTTSLDGFLWWPFIQPENQPTEKAFGFCPVSPSWGCYSARSDYFFCLSVCVNVIEKKKKKHEVAHPRRARTLSLSGNPGPLPGH